MSNPIRWNNVNAPNTGSPLDALRAAGGFFNAGADSFNKLITDTQAGNTRLEQAPVKTLEAELARFALNPGETPQDREAKLQQFSQQIAGFDPNKFDVNGLLSKLTTADAAARQRQSLLKTDRETQATEAARPITDRLRVLAQSADPEERAAATNALAVYADTGNVPNRDVAGLTEKLIGLQDAGASRERTLRDQGIKDQAIADTAALRERMTKERLNPVAGESSTDQFNRIKEHLYRINPAVAPALEEELRKQFAVSGPVGQDAAQIVKNQRALDSVSNVRNVLEEQRKAQLGSADIVGISLGDREGLSTIDSLLEQKGISLKAEDNIWGTSKYDQYQNIASMVLSDPKYKDIDVNVVSKFLDEALVKSAGASWQQDDAPAKLLKQRLDAYKKSDQFIKDATLSETKKADKRKANEAFFKLQLGIPSLVPSKGR